MCSNLHPSQAALSTASSDRRHGECTRRRCFHFAFQHSANPSSATIEERTNTPINTEGHGRAQGGQGSLGASRPHLLASKPPPLLISDLGRAYCPALMEHRHTKTTAPQSTRPNKSTIWLRFGCKLLCALEADLSYEGTRAAVLPGCPIPFSNAPLRFATDSVSCCLEGAPPARLAS